MSKRPMEGRPGAARSVLNPNESDPLLRFEYDRDSNYEIDTRITVALAALVPEAELHGPDHRSFQVIHLITEYSWCAMHHELRRACAALDADDFLLASQLLSRATALGDLPVQCVHLLQNFLPQVSMLQMRDLFPSNTSGLDSPGGRNVRRATTALWRNFEAAMERHGTGQTALAELYAREHGSAPDPTHAGLCAVQSSMHLLDCKIQEWRQVHLRLVRSHLGGHPAARDAADSRHTHAEASGPTSLRGSSIDPLERLTEQSIFPQLWKGVDATYQRMTSGTSSTESDSLCRPRSIR
jgi:tryptophan 2,3-dioxygenase